MNMLACQARVPAILVSPDPVAIARVAPAPGPLVPSGRRCDLPHRARAERRSAPVARTHPSLRRRAAWRRPGSSCLCVAGARSQRKAPSGSCTSRLSTSTSTIRTLPSPWQSSVGGERVVVDFVGSADRTALRRLEAARRPLDQGGRFIFYKRVVRSMTCIRRTRRRLRLRNDVREPAEHPARGHGVGLAHRLLRPRADAQVLGEPRFTSIRTTRGRSPQRWPDWWATRTCARALAQQGQERAAQFSWERCADEMFAFIASVAGTGSPRSAS